MNKSPKKFLFFLCSLLIACSILATPQQAKKFDAKAAKKKITVTYKKVPDGILAKYKNKNKTAVALTAKLSFRDADKKNLSKETQKNLCLGAGCTSYLLFKAPLDGYGNPLLYSTYKGSFSVAKSKYKNYSKKIVSLVDPQPALVNYTIMNQGKKNLSSVRATFLYYDQDKKLLGCQVKYLNCQEKGSSALGSLYYPYGIMSPTVEVNIDWAY